jgi:hypothetical protein
VLGALRSAEVETLVLGGMPGGGLPLPMERLDVMVPAERVADALGVLRGAGWRPAHPTWLGWYLQVGTGVVLELPPADTMALHTSPFWEPVAPEPIWERARSSELRGAQTLVPDPAHELMRACTGGLAVSPSPARWIPDAVSVIRTAGQEIDWDLLVDHAERWGMTARIEASLVILRTDFGEPVPPRALERLGEARRSLHERAAHRVGRRGPARGSHHVLQWHRHRSLRAIRPEAAGGFPEYWRASLGVDSWGAVAGRYARRLRRPLTH